MELSGPRPRRNSFVGWARRILSIPEVGVIIPMILLILLFNSKNGAMLTKLNLVVTLRTVVYVGVMAIGEGLLIMAGEIDLSVGSVCGLSAVIFATAMKAFGLPLPLAILAGLGTGALTGSINALMSVKVRLPSFITTLAMLYVARGVNYVITSGYPVYPLPSPVADFGALRPLGLSAGFVLWIVLIVVFDFAMRRTPFGSQLLATGGNQVASRIAGINTSRVKTTCFIIAGMLAATAGMLYVAQIKAGDPQIGRDMELDVIAGTVIGGVSLAGGIGTILGTALGVITMQVIRTGLVIFGAGPYAQWVALGAILIATASVDMLRRRSKRRYTE